MTINVSIGWMMTTTIMIQLGCQMFNAKGMLQKRLPWDFTQKKQQINDEE